MHKGKTATVSALSIALIALLGMGAIASASPTSVTGKITNIRVSAGATSDRVSIFMGNTTACSSQGWYAFENADSGLGKSWLDALMMALIFGKQITIVGTGICDAFSVESINLIDFKPV